VIAQARRTGIAHSMAYAALGAWGAVEMLVVWGAR